MVGRSRKLAAPVKENKPSRATYHIDNLGEGEAEGDVEGLGGVLGGSYPLVVVPHEVTHQSVLHVVTTTYRH